MGFGGRIRRNIADKHLSDCIRKAARWTCQRCNKSYEDKPQGLQCSHFIGRQHWGTRYDPRQMALCAYCHNWVESHPVDHIELWKAIHGKEDPDAELAKMVEVAACKGRAQYARANAKGAISAHYREESKRLDEELIKAKEGKPHDLTVYGYIKGPRSP